MVSNGVRLGIWIARADRARSIRYVSYRMDRIGLFCNIVDRIELSIHSIRSTPYYVLTSYVPSCTCYLLATRATIYRATGESVIPAYMYVGPASMWIVSCIEVHLTGSYRVSNGCPAVHRTDRIELILSSIQIPNLTTLKLWFDRGTTCKDL